ncbi:MAG: hypothetical protein JXQ73_19885 [Phycisphaerae bacterium]|nr:hypothetical protein [Phycisphaerae bacterium]
MILGRASTVVCAMVMCVLVAGCIPTTTPTTQDEYDIAVLAGAGTATQVSPGVYTITLTEVHDRVIAFTQAPGRTAQTFGTQWLGLWDKMYPDSPPNAVLYGRTPTDGTISVFEMGKPTYDAENDTLTFQATLVGDSPAPQAVMDDVDLLIDPTVGQWISIATNCGSAIVNIILAAVEEGVNPVADIRAAGASVGCIAAVATASW